MKSSQFLLLTKSIFLYSGLIALVIFSSSCAVPQIKETVYGQTNFRVRSDFGAALNADEGWAGALNENVSIRVDHPFRIRFEVTDSMDQSHSESYQIQYRRNHGDWLPVEAHDFPYPESMSPPVSLVSCDSYENHAGTTNLLNGSNAAFQEGAGITLADQTPSIDFSGEHSEFEWALVVRRYADGPITNEQGDTFEFRMILSDGGLFDQNNNPTLTLMIPPYHIGGTFVETPGRIGPFQASNGDLYFIMEPTEIDNDFMMIKSIDDGKTWREMDGVNRPRTDDLESVDARMAGDTIHIIHQVSEATVYHSFRTSIHAEQPDTWHIRDEPAGAVDAVAQMASLVVRSDGSMVTFYLGVEKLHYNIRSVDGVWGTQQAIDPDTFPNQAGPQAVLGDDDTIHLAYYGWDGSIWYRQLLDDGTLTTRQKIAEGAGTERQHYGSVLPLLYDANTGTVIIIYRLETGFLWERRIGPDGTPTAPVRVSDRSVITDAVDSQQPAADAVLDGNTVHVLFMDEESRSIYSTHDEGGWQSPLLQVDHIQGSWVRGAIHQRSDDTHVYGYVYDAGSQGGTGMNRYGSLELR